MKHVSEESNLVSLSVRVDRDTVEAFRKIAEAEFRPMAAELRRLIEDRVQTYPADGDRGIAA